MQLGKVLFIGNTTKHAGYHDDRSRDVFALFDQFTIRRPAVMHDDGCCGSRYALIIKYARTQTEQESYFYENETQFSFEILT